MCKRRMWQPAERSHTDVGRPHRQRLELFQSTKKFIQLRQRRRIRNKLCIKLFRNSLARLLINSWVCVGVLCFVCRMLSFADASECVTFLLHFDTCAWLEIGNGMRAYSRHSRSCSWCLCGTRTSNAYTKLFIWEIFCLRAHRTAIYSTSLSCIHVLAHKCVQKFIRQKCATQKEENFIRPSAILAWSLDCKCAV